MTDVVRTPEDRFADLPDWPHPPTWTDVTVDGTDLRLARVDVGPADAHPVVLLHGEPTWGFLWRHVLPPLLDAGLRVVVPDLVGFGRSDKPQPREWYGHDRLADALEQHLRDALGEDTPVTLVVHDWGGLLGLPWAATHRDRVARLVVLDTGLYRSGGRMSETWWAFRNHVEGLDAFPVADMVDGACRTDLAPEVRAAYEAPFPDPSHHGGPLALPLLVPTDDDSPGAAAHMAAWEVLEDWHDPVLFVWGEYDPIIPLKVGQRIAQLIPGTREFTTVPGSHFLQEDAGEEIGRRIAAFVRGT
jgi:haloalkane dehalogenase